MYSPREDSFLLSKVIEGYLSKIESEKLKKIKFLDMGTGTGIQAETAAKFLGKKNILSVDIDKEAVDYVKNRGFKVKHSDLFAEIKNKFEIIAFNAPYLPEDEHDKGIDTSGGKLGDEVILRFLEKAKEHLSENGKIFLVLSSLTPLGRIDEEINRQGMKKEVLVKQKLFFEEVEVWEIF